MIDIWHIFSRICQEFESIEQVALNAPTSTKAMIELGEFMLNVKNKKIVDLNVSFQPRMLRPHCNKAAEMIKYPRTKYSVQIYMLMIIIDQP